MQYIHNNSIYKAELQIFEAQLIHSYCFILRQVFLQLVIQVVQALLLKMRYKEFKKDKYYLVEGFGAACQQIFFDDEDRVRFIFLITHMLSPIRVINVSWYASRFLKTGSFRIGEAKVDSIYSKAELSLIAFGVYSKSFMLLVHTNADFILSVYMQRVLTSYGKYFNSKYKRRGHVFNGPFTANEVVSKDLHESSAYIHMYAGENGDIKFEDYKWTSYVDFIALNRWGKLLSCEKILSKFKAGSYSEYLKNLDLRQLKDKFSLTAL